MIYDCFTFYNEMELLEIRLNSLDPVVDCFVLVESTHTHAGQPKRLYYDEAKHTPLFDRFAKKTRHIIVDEPPDADRWVNENRHRNAIMEGLAGLQPEDIVIVTDIDEIPDPAAFPRIGTIETPHRIVQNLYYYFFNCQALNCQWSRPACARGKDLVTPQELRMLETDKVIPHGGWHFSYIGSPEKIACKIGSFAHAEFDTAYYTDTARIRDCMMRKVDLFVRDIYDFAIVPLEGPPYLLENRERFGEFIVKGEERKESLHV